MSGTNILLVMADQLAPHFTGTYGHPLVATPHLDSLVRERVLASQRDRHLLHKAMDAGPPVSWDHTPYNDAANSWVRNHQDVVDAALNSRLPVTEPDG